MSSMKPLPRIAEPVQRWKRFGEKQLFLPNHVIALLRPKPKQSPHLATFAVPLQFNKLDLRDYLHHAYGVETTAIRSFINQPKPERKNRNGPWYRPRAQKMMIAELVKPFVWPEPVTEEEALKQWDHEMYKQLQKDRRAQEKKQKNPKNVPLRTKLAVPEDLRNVAQQARELLRKAKGLDVEGEEAKKEVKTEVKTEEKKEEKKEEQKVESNEL
ncbi:putative mitochondrial LSU ribosomal protein L23 precursor [Triangularia verruculosa]|uniref:Large ribosomal subunit protein uL23m n=1 Tax=Triangularia verruculosa TaxID=2587418 RepID=A0AAN6XFH0_9PEZI|nr:putative mitochondrial LSU ribosomal protein L23 precursor [Triangularia verruculosa]